MEILNHYGFSLSSTMPISELPRLLLASSCMDACLFVRSQHDGEVTCNSIFIPRRPLAIRWKEAHNRKESGICWAISVASAVEAVMNLHRAEDDDTQWMTSSQELMDWVQSDLDNIKNSGLRRMYNVWNHVFKKKVSKEENYKYVGEPALEKERFALGVTIPERVVLRISGFEVIEPVDDERLLLRQLATMPVVASLEATPSFLDWKGQTIFTRDTETTEDQKTRRDKKVELHSILVVGVTRRLNYFLIRNSYGKDWVFKIRGADRRWTAKGLGKVLRASSRSSRQSLFTSFSYPKPWVPP